MNYVCVVRAIHSWAIFYLHNRDFNCVTLLEFFYHNSRVNCKTVCKTMEVFNSALFAYVFVFLEQDNSKFLNAHDDASVVLIFR